MNRMVTLEACLCVCGGGDRAEMGAGKGGGPGRAWGLQGGEGGWEGLGLGGRVSASFRGLG